MVHIVRPKAVDLDKMDGNVVSFRGQRGEQLRITVLEEDIVRVQHWPEGRPRLQRTWMVAGPAGDVPREGRLRDDLSGFGLPSFQVRTLPSGPQLLTSALQVTAHLGDFHLSWADLDGHIFAEDLPGRAYSYDERGRAVFHYLHRRPDEHYYGLGERSGPLDKRGRRYRMVNLDALGYDAADGDPLYKHFPFYITFIPELNLAYGLLYDNLATTVFDLGKEIDNYYAPYRYYQAEDGDIDYYLIYGPSLQQVVEKMARLTGPMALPPRWSLGYLASTMTYTEAPDAQNKLEQFISLCRSHEIPCDLFHLSSGYGSDEEGRRYVFNWNLKKIPDPKALSASFHQAGIRLAANIKPALLTSHPQFEEVAALGGFIRAHDEDVPELSAFWGGEGAHIDFTNPQAYDWWKQRVKDRILNFGIDATWNDNNEYPIWNDEARCHGFGQPLPITLIRPLHSLLMARASREAQQECNPQTRPFLICRSGCPGIQRYAQTWSGDNYTCWQTLRYNIPMGLGLGLSGAPNTGHDVGGFAGPKPDAELFVRWVQNGIFQPRFTIHSWNSDGTANEPWMYPDMLPLVREAIKFRYRLLPYLYSLFVEAHRTGHPILRPLVYHFPNDPRTHTESFDFMLGPNLLVASVLESGARTRAVYLPGSQPWCDFYTGEWYEPGQTVLLDAPLDRFPLLAPAGGIIPMGKAMRHVSEQPDDLRQVYVFPHPERGRGEFTLVEDDGVSLDYQAGGVTELKLEVTAMPDHLALTVHPMANGYPLPYREIEFILPPGEQRPVKTARGVSYERRGDGVHVMVPLG